MSSKKDNFIDKTFYVKYLYEPNYQYFITNREKAGLTLELE